MSGQKRQISVEVWRGDEKGGRFETYCVPRYESQTVLDVVSWIQQNSDATLTYRFACRVGMCGSCAMMVNDVPRWTCRTHVSKVSSGDRLKLAPLRNLPVIKDLAAEMDPFFNKWTTSSFQPTASRDDEIVTINPDDPRRVAASAGIECINCAVCYAACDTVSGNPDYLGPAALNRAWTLLNDDKSGGDVLTAVSGPNGCHNCHSTGACSALCPNELDPMASIAKLKRETLRKAFRRA